MNCVHSTYPRILCRGVDANLGEDRMRTVLSLALLSGVAGSAWMDCSEREGIELPMLIFDQVCTTPPRPSSLHCACYVLSPIGWLGWWLPLRPFGVACAC